MFWTPISIVGFFTVAGITLRGRCHAARPPDDGFAPLAGECGQNGLCLRRVLGGVLHNRNFV